MKIDDLTLFPADGKVRKNLARLMAGKVPVITLKLIDVGAAGVPGREQLSAFANAIELGYWHDPFLDEWRLTRPKPLIRGVNVMSEARMVRLGALEHDPVAIAGNEARLDKTDDLYASIPVHGLNQSLRVRPWDPAWVTPSSAPAAKAKGKKGSSAPRSGEDANRSGDPGPEFGVMAGNRRLRTLRRLRDAGEAILGVVVTDDWLVPVILGDANDADAFEITSAENVQRLALTPVEEFRAFEKMAQKLPVKEVAAHFGVPEKRVQQRLKLAALHPDVLAALERGKISMEAAQAFTVEPDPQRQASYLKKARGSWDLSADTIKRAFTNDLVRSDSVIAKQIGKKAYLDAGGEILGDIFGDTSYWISPEIIERLLAERLKAQKAEWAEAGWLFVETVEEFGKDTHFGNSAIYYAVELQPEMAPLTAELQAEADGIAAKIAAIDEAEEAAEEESDEAELAEYVRLEERLEEIDAGRERGFTAEQKAISGVVFWPDGSRAPKLGMLRYGTKAPGSDPEKAAASLNELMPAVAADLNLVVTMALQKKVAAEPMMALRLLTATFHGMLHKVGSDPKIRIQLYPVKYPAKQDDMPQGQSFASALAWASAQDGHTLLAHLAQLVAPVIDLRGMQSGRGPNDAALIDFVDPPMPFDAAAYFAGVTKPLIALAYADMTGGEALKDAKKGEMASKAVAKARETRWLPPQLRTPSYAGPGAKAAAPEETEADVDDDEQLEAAE